MQRLQRTTLVVLVVLFLSSCTEEQPLEPVEILKRSIIRNTTIESASFSASAFVVTKGYATLSGSAVLQGILRGTGGWSADISFQGRESVGSSIVESGKIRMVTLDGSQIFLQPQSVQGPRLESIVKSLTGSLNGWWSIGRPSAGTSVRTTMSPMRLNQIASLFLINAAAGPEKFIGRDRAYRLNISLSPDAVRTLFADSAKENTAVTGTLWIDAKNFTLLRASWYAQDILTALGPADLVIDVTLADINAAPNIVLPTGSSGVLSLNSVFATISH